MPDRGLVEKAIAELAKNPEQYEAVHEKQHCVVLAGPGSGKTKTLTVAMARALLDDVIEPRGIACITYNNECALELEGRLAKLGVEPSANVFIGTVHSFALSQVIAPYARCVMPELPQAFLVANQAQRRGAVEASYRRAINAGENPHNRWRFAETKRRSQVDRSRAEWRGRNPELADFIEAYELELHQQGLLDFEDMPLIAYRMIQQHPWIGRSLNARFPILFVDEYQDLGHALHELVQKLCFESGTRLFAVGDADQSIYAFTGANPRLLQALSQRDGVRTITLRFNYRCAPNIIDASMAALGEERGYVAPEGTAEGAVVYRGIRGSLIAQADHVANVLLPDVLSRGISLQEIAVLYRTADEGSIVASALVDAGFPIARADNQAIVRRNSRFSRLIEACAKWVAGGWKDVDPPFRRLADEATSLVFGYMASVEERRQIELELITFLHGSIGQYESLNSWLTAFQQQLVVPWNARTRNKGEEWAAIAEMIERTNPEGPDSALSLAHFGGRIEGGGRLNLSTLHSAKGREFDAVILFAMNEGVIPSTRDQSSADSLREARRLFYVGVTRARRELYVCFTKDRHSPWVTELQGRTEARI